MVVYDKEEKRVVIPAHINFETYDEYREGYEVGYSSGYTDGLNSCVIEYDKMYFTIEALEDGTITPRKNVGYSINGGDWVEAEDGVVIPVASCDSVRFKFVATEESLPMQMFFDNGIPCNVYGNIMSLVYGDDFYGQTVITYPNSFGSLFSISTGILNAENLVLPATTLSDSCYAYMFSGCTNLTTTPELPATTLSSSCYKEMFSGCASITIAPELPATTLSENCYARMFKGCTSLTTAPELPAEILTSSCYIGMFAGCTSLITAPVLSSTTIAYSCYSGMFQGCTNITTAPSLPATTLTDGCYRGMFEGCTSLVNATELPATRLYRNCYNSMFAGCTSLTTAPELPDATISSLNTNVYGAMFSGCTNLNYIKCLSTQRSNYLERNATNWVLGVSPTGTFVKNPNMSGWTTGVNGIPEGWTVVDAT